MTELGDVLEEQDPRIYRLTHSLEEICTAFELTIRWTAALPTNQHSDVMLFQSVSAADAAALMVYLRELGFEVDPSVFIKVLEPDLRKRGRLTKAEMDLLFFSRTTDRLQLRIRHTARGALGQ